MKWISVTERLPTKKQSDTWRLFITDGKYVCRGDLSLSGEIIYIGKNIAERFKVNETTHWMRLEDIPLPMDNNNP